MLRGLLQLEQQGAERFFGEPMLDVEDLLQTIEGRGVVNILAADKLVLAPRLYSTFLLWLGRREGMVDVLAKSAARSVGSSVARELTRGLLGSLLGGGRRR